MKEYDDYYKRMKNNGDEYQDFVTDEFLKIGLPILFYNSKKYQYKKGESANGFEIKFDDKYKETGNLYIELFEKTNPNNVEYIESGINRNDNTVFYIIGDYDAVFLFSKTMLNLIKNNYKIVENKTKTSKGFLLPNRDAIKFSINIIEINQVGLDKWM